MSTPTEKDIDQLNSFLRGERSALDTYDQVLEKAESLVVKTGLKQGRDSHQERVRLLEDKIRSLGGKPADDSGVWGSFAKAVEGGAKLFGVATAVSVLEEGEDHGLKDYQRDLSDLSPGSQTFVRTSLLPKQQQSHDLLSRLQELA